MQMDTTWNIQQCWELLNNNVASVCTGLDNAEIQPHYCVGNEWQQQ